MADRWLFAGGGAETLRVLAGTMSTTTSGGTFNSSYADHAVTATSSNRYAADFIDASGVSDTVTTGEKLCVHAHVDANSSSATAASVLELIDGSDQPWVAIRNTGTLRTLGLYYNSGSGASPAWTQVPGSGTTTFTDGSDLDFDIEITLGSPHAILWAVNATQIGSGTFTQASLTSLDAIGLRNNTGASAFNYSEVAASVGISLVNGHVFYSKPTGSGANSGFSGTSADIDDAGINDTDALSAASASLRSTFAYSNVPTLAANEAIGDVFLWTRARNSGGSPSNVAPVRRNSGGTDLTGSNFSGISGAYQSFLTRYSGLSESEFNASEFGVESAT